jgi:hypothetical protein
MFKFGRADLILGTRGKNLDSLIPPLVDLHPYRRPPVVTGLTSFHEFR